MKNLLKLTALTLMATLMTTAFGMLRSPRAAFRPALARAMSAATLTQVKSQEQILAQRMNAILKAQYPITFVRKNGTVVTESLYPHWTDIRYIAPKESIATNNPIDSDDISAIDKNGTVINFWTKRDPGITY